MTHFVILSCETKTQHYSVHQDQTLEAKTGSLKNMSFKTPEPSLQAKRDIVS